MSIVSEFKSFVMRGNVIDLAIGVIIGGAFGAIVNSLVADIITPIMLQPALEAADVAKLEDFRPGGMLVGKFLSSVISFVVIAFVLFLIVKGANAAMKKQEQAPAAPAPPPAPSKEELLLTEIRDLLKK